MGFSLFHALGGAAEQYSDIEDEKRRAKLEESREIGRAIRDNALTTFGEYQKTKKQNEALAKQLRGLQLDDQKVIGLIDYNPQQAQYFAENAHKVLGAINADRPDGQKLTANDLINLANPEETGVDYEEGLRNISGVYDPEGGFEFDPDTQYGKAITSLATALGQDPAELAAITSGNLSYGRGPQVGFADEWMQMEGLGMRADMAQIRNLELTGDEKELRVRALPTQLELETRDKQLQVQQREFAVSQQAGDALLDRTEQLARIRAANNADEKHNAEMATLDDLLAAELKKAQADAKEAEDGTPKTPPDAQIEAKRAQDSFNEMMNLRLQTTTVEGKPLLAIDPDTGVLDFAGSPAAIAKRNELAVKAGQDYLAASAETGAFTPAQMAHKVSAVKAVLTDEQLSEAFAPVELTDETQTMMEKTPYKIYSTVYNGRSRLCYYDPRTGYVEMLGG